MSQFSKEFLSGGTGDGRPIAVAAVASPGTVVHTAVAGGVDKDLLEIQAVNIDAVPHTLTIELGGTSTSDTVVVQLAPLTGSVVVVSRQPLNGLKVVRAYMEAGAANLVNILGHVNRITQ